MKQVTTQAFIDGVNAIYKEQPTYQLGHDGSDGTCDCIGMVRGGLKRAGATDVKGMNGTNYAARFTVKDLRKINSADSLGVGDVVFKTRPADDPEMPLPDRYRKGGADYTGDLTNYTHIGTVTHIDPLEITHMTTPTAKKDKKLGKWEYAALLPWVETDIAPEPQPEPTPEPLTATVIAEHGTTVKMRAKPSTKCSLYWDVPIGATVDVNERGDEWSNITYKGQTGWMMTKHLAFVACLWTVHIPYLTEDQAQALLSEYPGAWMTSE